MNSHGKRIAQEAQLLAEERFIVNALKKFRNQRNCLQIERLQLESMLAQVKFNPMPKGPGETCAGVPTAADAAVTTSSITDADRMESHSQLVSICNPLTTPMDTRERELNEELCNFEELNLSVTLTKPVLNLQDISMNIEFEDDNNSEEDDSDDTDHEDNVEIDMNMFMNAESKEQD